MLFLSLVTAWAAGPYLAPELSLRVLQQGSRVPDKVTCDILSCDQRPVYPVTLGATLLLDQPVFFQVRRVSFLNHREDARPYALDLRAGGWATAARSSESGPFWVPKEELFAFAGLRVVHDTGDGDVLLDATALQLGVLSHYTADTLPEGVSGYVEVTYLRVLTAEWTRQDPSRKFWGYVFRVGANVQPLSFGANITADPGFGFSAMLELGLRGGFSLRPGEY